PSSTRNQGSASRTELLVRPGRLFDEAGGGVPRPVAVRDRRQVAGELHQVGLGEEVAEEAAVRAVEPTFTCRGEEELLGRHLRRPQPELLLEIGADDVGERRVVFLEGALADEGTALELGER